MQESQDLWVRLSHIERSNRRWKIAFSIALTIVAFFCVVNFIGLKTLPAIVIKTVGDQFTKSITDHFDKSLSDVATPTLQGIATAFNTRLDHLDKLVIHDSAGRSRIVLDGECKSDDSLTGGNWSAISVLDENGKKRMLMAACKEGSTLSLKNINEDPSVAFAQMKGTSMFVMKDENTKPRIVIGTSGDGARQIFYDKDGATPLQTIP